ncbi:MAG: hypothetical protein ABSE90_12435 [Verrucomicrobiota bacterium]
MAAKERKEHKGDFISALFAFLAHLDTVLVAQPSPGCEFPLRLAARAASLGWIRAARRRPNQQARTPALRFCRVTPRTVSRCTIAFFFAADLFVSFCALRGLIL